MSKVIILIGLPAAGKSTWRAKQPSGFHIYSTDDLVEEYAAEHFCTYNDAWGSVINDMTRQANQKLNSAIAKGIPVIADRTNLTPGARKKILSRFPPKVYPVREAIVFPIPEESVHRKRLESRKGKVIPWGTIEQMKQQYVSPTIEEGFTVIRMAE